jgi:3' terminal RNA ribose 2'-O-methyltransferase Hen1
LQYQQTLTRKALELLQDDEEDVDAVAEAQSQVELALEKKISLHTIRLSSVANKIGELGARKVLDLGCGEGKLVKLLLKNPNIDHVLACDVSMQSLQRASRNLKIDTVSDRQRARVSLQHGSLLYRDAAWEDFDVAALVEVIEHLDAARLTAMEKVVFGYAKPRHVVITTPNIEYNVKFESLAAGAFRHADHRFEWTRAEFKEWGDRVAEEFDYQVSYEPLGDEDPDLGAPSQMAVFSR